MTREMLAEVLERWKAGLITEAQVQEWAESFTDESDYPDVSHSEDDSIANEVLLRLDALPMMLLTKNDIPAVIRFLETPCGQAEEGWREWEAYWDSIDVEERRQEVADNPFYME